MKHIKEFNQFLNEDRPKGNHSIFDFIDYDYPDEPQFYITGYEEEQPEDIESGIKADLKKGKLKFEIGSADGDDVVMVTTDRNGKIKDYEILDGDGFAFGAMTGHPDF